MNKKYKITCFLAILQIACRLFANTNLSSFQPLMLSNAVISHPTNFLDANNIIYTSSTGSPGDVLTFSESGMAQWQAISGQEITFGITTNDVYRGDWGLYLSNQVDALEVATNYFDNRADALEGATNSLNVRAGSLETATNALNIRADVLEVATNTLNIRAESLEIATNSLEMSKLNISGGEMTGTLTNIFGVCISTNQIILKGGVLNGTNGVYFQLGTNNYWILLTGE